MAEWLKPLIDWLKSIAAYFAGVLAGYQMERNRRLVNEAIEQANRAEKMREAQQQLEVAESLSAGERADILRDAAERLRAKR